MDSRRLAIAPQLTREHRITRLRSKLDDQMDLNKSNGGQEGSFPLSSFRRPHFLVDQ